MAVTETKRTIKGEAEEAVDKITTTKAEDTIMEDGTKDNNDNKEKKKTLDVVAGLAVDTTKITTEGVAVEVILALVSVSVLTAIVYEYGNSNTNKVGWEC